MKPKKNDTSKGMSLKSLEAALRRFPDVEIPEKLKKKLDVIMSQPRSIVAADSCRRRRLGFWSFGGAAAASVVFGIIGIAVYMPNFTGHGVAFSPACPNYACVDQNVAAVQDINTSLIERR
jgi:hypothetical protein